jgi:hypothetical protein
MRNVGTSRARQASLALGPPKPAAVPKARVYNYDFSEPDPRAVPRPGWVTPEWLRLKDED